MTLTSLSLRHVTLGIVECKKETACTRIADRFEANTVLCSFYTMQPSSFIMYKATTTSKNENFM